MSVKFHRATYKQEARQLVKEGSVSPLGFTALFIGATLALEVLATLLSESVFVSLLTGLCSTVLGGGMILYCMGLRRREHMPFSTLLDGFAFAGKLIWLQLRMSLRVGAAYIIGIFSSCMLASIIGVAAMGDDFATMLMGYITQLEAVEAGAAWSFELLPLLLGTFLVLLVACIPALCVAYSLRFALYNLCTDPGLRVGDCIRLSRQQTRGFRLQLWLLDLSFFPWYLLTALTMGLLLIWLMPYVQVTNLGIYTFCSREKGLEVLPPVQEAPQPGEF